MRKRRVLAAAAAVFTLAFVGVTGSPAVAVTPHVASSSVAAPQDKLPDLTMRPLKKFHLGKVNGQRVVRFSTPLVNEGIGPIEILATRPNTRTPYLSVVQRIYQSNGRVRTVPTKAVVRYAIRDGHPHFHVYDFELYRLRLANSHAWRGSHKEGYCFTDDKRVFGKTPKGYSEGRGACARKKPNAKRVGMGLTPGWVDEYDWDLPGQYIDLKGLPLPGIFCVQAIADPHHFFREQTRSNNTTQTLVRVTSRKLQVIRQGC